MQKITLYARDSAVKVYKDVTEVGWRDAKDIWKIRFKSGGLSVISNLDYVVEEVEDFVKEK